MPINGYGLIGDCRSAALVASDGSIDWLCLPRFDDSFVFGRLLDAERGGFWSIRPTARHEVLQKYRDRTNILCTTFSTSSGVVAVTDFMPVDPSTLDHPARLHHIPRVVRIVECLTGVVEMDTTIHATTQYGKKRLPLRWNDGLLHGDDEMHVCVQSTRTLNPRSTRYTLKTGESVAFGLRTSKPNHCGRHRWDLKRAHELFRITREYWWGWIGNCRYDGPYQEPVWRSALALKLMTYSPSGAIVAAPTTSLPELIGSYHNYDYRFTWLRDAAFTLYAFFQLGLRDEAHGYFDWLTKLGLGNQKTELLNLYSVDGGTEVQESELAHLDGYRHSRPVRVGNAAVDQLQLDVYGEILDSAYLYARFGGTIERGLWRELHRIVELACARWQEPDASIWEVRNDNQQFTYSKVMCWVAVDRGLRIAEKFKFPHDAKRWRGVRHAIHSSVTGDGWSKKRNAFTQYFGGDKLDAAVLRMSQVRFLDDHDPRMFSTVKAIRRELADGVLVRRYRRAANDYGHKRREGAFLLCSFWLVDALAHLGEVEEAERVFERVLAFGSPLNLFAEECDPVNGEALGNYPQAFTHLALVGAAVNIERARHRRIAPRGLRPRHPSRV